MNQLPPGFDPRTGTYRDPPPPRESDPWGWELGGTVQDGLDTMIWPDHAVINDPALWIDTRSRGIYTDGTHATETTTGIQSAIDDVIANNGGTVLNPPGSLLVTTLAFEKAQGVNFKGVAPFATRFRPSGNYGTWTSATAAGTAVIDIVGTYASSFSDFGIDGTGWTGTALNAFQIYGDPARGGGFTSGNVISRVYITNMALCRNYFATGTNAATFECDNISYYDCRAIPSPLWGSATLSVGIDAVVDNFVLVDSFSQMGRLPAANFVLVMGTEQMLVGTRVGTAVAGVTRAYNGTAGAPHLAGVNVDRADYLWGGYAFGGPAYGNKYIYQVHGCVSLGFRYNLMATQTQMVWLGGNLGSGGTDIFRVGQGYFEAGGFESQESRMLLEGNPANTAACQLHLHDCNWASPTAQAVSGVIVQWDSGGSATFERVACWNTRTPATFAFAPIVELCVMTRGTQSQAKVRTFLASASNLVRVAVAHSYTASSGATLATHHLDDRLPGTIQVAPFFTPVAQTNWNAFAVVAAAAMGGAWQSDGTQNAEVNYDLQINAATWTISVMFTADPNGGIMAVALDDGHGVFTSVGTVNTYAAAPAANQIITITGVVVDSAIRRRLRLKLATKDAASGGYVGNLQLVSMIRTAA